MATYSKETALYDTGAIASGITGAGQTANAYMTEVSSAGVFVHEYDTSGQQPTDTGANGVHISDDVDIIRNGEIVASYGATTVVGKNDGAHVEISKDGFTVKNVDKAPMFSIESSSSSVAISTKMIISESDGAINPGETKSFTIQDTIVSGTQIVVYGSGFSIVRFTEGTADTQYVTAFVHVRYDGDSTVTVNTSPSTPGIVYVRGLDYYISSTAPIFVYGDTREPSAGFSSTLGHGLVAASEYQTVIGKYNVADTNGDYAFIVGRGSESYPRNAMTVDWNGKVNAAGVINASGYTVGGNPLIETVTKTESTGSFTGYKNLTITPTAPNGKTLIAIGSIHVNGNGSSNCQLIGFYIDSGTIHVQMKNTSSTSYTWTIDVIGVYA